MKITTVLAVPALLLPLALAVPDPALAQLNPPPTALAQGIPRDALERLWCAEMFLAEAYWLQAEEDFESAAEYGTEGERLLNAIPAVPSGVEASRIEALQGAYRARAANLADVDGEGYWRALHACEAAFSLAAGEPAAIADPASPLSEEKRFEAGLAAYERRNYAEALDHFSALAATGHGAALFHLAHMHHLGHGTSPNLGEAYALYLESAEAGYADGQYVTARAYHMGIGMPQDEELSVRWMERAAEQGHAGAQFHLGLLYRDGNGFAQDLEEAIRLFGLAAAQGDADARAALQLLDAAGGN